MTINEYSGHEMPNIDFETNVRKLFSVSSGIANASRKDNMRYCKLRQKEVVNVVEGKTLGYISDLVLDDATGKICSIVVPGGGGVKSFFKNHSYIIPWENICKIGDDVILVEVDLSVCSVVE